MLPHLKRLNVLLAELKRRHVFRALALYAVAAWAVVEVASTVLPVFPIPDPDGVIRTLVVLVVLGFPLVLVLAWAFDLTTEGVQRTEEDETVPPAVLHFLRSRTFRATLVLLVLFLTGGAGWASWQLWLRPGIGSGAGTDGDAPPLDPTHLAVLYFDDFSPDGELEYLANGITEALIHEFSGVELLRVVSRNGVKPFRDLDIPVDSLARVLGVGTLVEGSVEGQGDRIAVTVQLIDGKSGLHLLSERIEGAGEDVLTLRDGIVQEAVRLLGQFLGRELQRREREADAGDPRAWDLYQRAQSLREDADTLRWALGDTLSAIRTLARADSLFARATDLDPQWVDPTIARGWIARTRAGILSASQTTRDRDLLEAGLALAEMALAQSPGSPEALELRGSLRVDLLKRADAEGAEELARLAEADLRAAVEIDPSRVYAWIFLADFLRMRGEFQEASVAENHALDADPFLINAEREVLFVLSQVWLDLGEVDRASRWYDEGRRRYPAEPSFPATKLVILAGQGGELGALDTAMALEAQVAEGLVRKEWPLGSLLVAAVQAQHGLADSALARIEKVRGANQGGVWRPYYEANARLNLGQEEEALSLLEEFLADFPQRKAYISRDWWWEPLRSAPRFQAMVGEGVRR